VHRRRVHITQPSGSHPALPLGLGTGSHNDSATASFHAGHALTGNRLAQRTHQALSQARAAAAPRAHLLDGLCASQKLPQVSRKACSAFDAVKKAQLSKRSELRAGVGRSKGMAMLETKSHHRIVTRMPKAPEVRRS
jgi:hypothetical protein